MLFPKRHDQRSIGHKCTHTHTLTEWVSDLLCVWHFGMLRLSSPFEMPQKACPDSEQSLNYWITANHKWPEQKQPQTWKWHFVFRSQERVNAFVVPVSASFTRSVAPPTRLCIENNRMSESLCSRVTASTHFRLYINDLEEENRRTRLMSPCKFLKLSGLIDQWWLLSWKQVRGFCVQNPYHEQ